MAESTLSLDYSMIRRAIGRFLGWDRDPANWSATQTTDGTDFLRQGARQFYWAPPLPGERTAHEWSFLRPTTTIDLWGSQSSTCDGAPTDVANSVVTADDSIFFPSMVGHAITIGSTTTTVVSYTSATQATVGANVNSEGDEAAITLTSDGVYRLPDDYGAMEGDLTFALADSRTQRIQIAGEGHIRQAWNQYGSGHTSTPLLAAVRPIAAHDATVGQRFELLAAPVPDGDYTISFRYQANPDLLDDTDVYHLGGTPHAQTFLESCLAIAERTMNDVEGIHYAAFLRALAASVSFDRNANSPRRQGYNRDDSDGVAALDTAHGQVGTVVRYNDQDPLYYGS